MTHSKSRSRTKKRAKKRLKRAEEARHWKGIHDEKPPVEHVVVNGRPALRIKCRDRCLRQAELDQQGKGEQCPCEFDN